MRFFGFSNRGQTLQRVALWLGTASVLVALGMFAYQGTFTRFLADDYCESNNVAGGVLPALAQRYMTVSDRYSNLLFVALSEAVFPRNVQVVPVVMLALWTAAMIWLVHEARKLAGQAWPFAADALLGGLLAFFPVLEAPNRFQTIYWRSGMATHFAPLVYLTAFTALLLWLIRRMEGRRPPIWLGVFCLLVAFFGGGFSEPPDAILIVASLIALVAVWQWEQGPRRTGALRLLGWTLAGGILALAVMVASPAQSFRMGTPPPAPGLFLYRTVLYPLQFIRDSLETLPLPMLVSVLIPAVVLFGLFACAPALSAEKRRRMALLMGVAIALMYGLIAASFAPSIYGQGYPVERARFAARLVMTTTAVFEGASLGAFAAQWRRLQAREWLVGLASVAVVVMALYPLRAAGNILREDLPYTRRWAAAWDARQAQVYRQKAKGVQDVVIRQLPGFEDVKELDVRPRFWVNRCAAAFYGVQSISAPQGQELH
jgi:hypothetical protein